MCFGGSVPQDNSGAIAAQQQATKEANIKSGQAAIQKVFGGNQIGAGAVTSYDPSQTYYNADGTVYTPRAAQQGTPVTDPKTGLVTYTGGSAVSTPDLTTIFSGTTTNPGQFGPDYYNNISQNYENYYDPQLATQYQNALNQLTLQLGQQGILKSSEGNRQLALLKQNNTTQQQTIANNALAQSTAAKQAVGSEENTLLANNETAADPSTAAEQAAAGAQAVQSTPTFSPLGSVFAGLLGQGTNALSIQQGGLAGTNQGGGTFITPFTNTSALGSGSNTGSSSNGAVVGG